MRILIVLSFFILSGGCQMSITDVFQSRNVEPPAQLTVAEQFVGMNEQTDRVTLKEFMGIDPARVEWCAAFVNSVLSDVDITGTGSLMARSYLDWGKSTDTPSPGDIMVFSRGNSNWQGHVGFYVATVTYKNTAYWIVLGGNQDNSVSYRMYKVGHRRHLETRTLNDAPVKLETLRAMQWMLDGIPLEVIRDNAN